MTDSDPARTERAPEEHSRSTADPATGASPSGSGDNSSGDDSSGGSPSGAPRRRGSRGGRNRSRSGTRPPGEAADGAESPDRDDAGEAPTAPRPAKNPAAGKPSAARPPKAPAALAGGDDARTGVVPDLPDRPNQNRPTAEAAEKALVRKPQIGDSMPAPADEAKPAADGDPESPARRKRRRGGRGRGSGSGGGAAKASGNAGSANGGTRSSGGGGGGGRGSGNGNGNGNGGGGGGGRGGGRGGGGGRNRTRSEPVRAVTDGEPIELDEETLEKRRGRERKGKALGRYLMAVNVHERATQIAVLEGRSLLEHYVSHPADDISQIHGNIYLGKVQNVLPGMEAAFVDIGTPKNAVLYRGDTRYDPEDIEEKGANPRIEEILRARQAIICQVTKNPIGAKGARLTQEVSLPGRFVVLVPNSTTYGISKRLPENERKRLRGILDKARPKGHGLIVRTAAEGVLAEEIERDVARLASQWEQIEALAKKSQAPTLLYREPDMAVRVIREEFNKDYRKVVIDDEALFTEVRDYVRSISPELADRVEHYQPGTDGLPVMEEFHVHEQLHKALD
ncbi:MAG TPA: ribonuclease E/G, partial [Acidimicrobiales bacterium]